MTTPSGAATVLAFSECFLRPSASRGCLSPLLCRTWLCCTLWTGARVSKGFLSRVKMPTGRVLRRLWQREEVMTTSPPPLASAIRIHARTHARTHTHKHTHARTHARTHKIYFFACNRIICIFHACMHPKSRSTATCWSLCDSRLSNFKRQAPLCASQDGGLSVILRSSATSV
jgi:hypothetical protein